jgi:hypothetical protein
MRAQKLREEAAKKERDEHFNGIRPVIPTKQEWRVKEKANTPASTTFDDDMDLLDDEEAPLIKDGSPPLTNMDVNMVFTLPTEFRSAKEEVAQICLSPKETMFEKPEESSQHLKSLYVQGHIDGKPISRMLINGGAVINLTLNDVGGNPMEARGVVSMELTVGRKSLATAFFIVEVQGNYSVILGFCSYVSSYNQTMTVSRLGFKLRWPNSSCFI